MKNHLKKITRWIGLRIPFHVFQLSSPCAHSNRLIVIQATHENFVWFEWKYGEQDKLEAFLWDWFYIDFAY